jgi:hypothetical protein
MKDEAGFSSRPAVYCIKCGKYSSERCHGLKETCPGKIETRGHSLKMLARIGRHPTKKYQYVVRRWHIGNTRKLWKDEDKEVGRKITDNEWREESRGFIGSVFEMVEPEEVKEGNNGKPPTALTELKLRMDEKGTFEDCEPGSGESEEWSVAEQLHFFGLST